MPQFSLQELADRLGLAVIGQAQTRISGVCGVDPGEPGCIAFVADSRYLERVATTRAAAVIVGAAQSEVATNGLLAEHPQWAFAQVAALFALPEGPVEGIHSDATIDASAQLGPGCAVGARAVIGSGVVVGGGCRIGAGTTIDRDAQLGPDCDVGSNVSIAARVRIGARALILPGAVIGSRGFGNVPVAGAWRTMPQLGSVRIGDDVEIGANTCIDRGALGDTLIGNGVKIDNQCQIAHNVVIGDHTALAAGVGIAGSAVIGRHCMLGGQVGVNGHIQLVDGVIINGGGKVLQSVTEPGQYGSGAPLMPVGQWRRFMALMGRLEARLKRLERKPER